MVKKKDKSGILQYQRSNHAQPGQTVCLCLFLILHSLFALRSSVGSQYKTMLRI